MNRNKQLPSSVMIKVFILGTMLLILLTTNGTYFHNTLAKSDEVKTIESISNSSGSASGNLSSANFEKNIQSTSDLASTNMPNENQSELKIKSINALNGSESGTTDNLENGIAKAYGGMFGEDKMIKPSATIFDSQEYDSSDGCLVNEIPITTISTNDNISSSIPANGNNSKEQSAPWVQVDLGIQKQVCGVKIQLREANNEVKFFTIQLSTNGTSFTLPKYYSNTGSGSSGEIYNLGKDSVSARYVRLTELGKIGADTGWISDLKVFGIKE
ncbi:MAG TPA: discoidin domain-containing protein [Nitrososphaeraceae archaeon]